MGQPPSDIAGTGPSDVPPAFMSWSGCCCGPGCWIGPGTCIGPSTCISPGCCISPCASASRIFSQATRRANVLAASAKSTRTIAFETELLYYTELPLYDVRCSNSTGAKNYETTPTEALLACIVKIRGAPSDYPSLCRRSPRYDSILARRFPAYQVDQARHRSVRVSLASLPLQPYDVS